MNIRNVLLISNSLISSRATTCKVKAVFVSRMQWSIWSETETLKFWTMSVRKYLFQLDRTEKFPFLHLRTVSYVDPNRRRRKSLETKQVNQSLWPETGES